MNIRKATESDATAVAAIIIPIIREGTTYTLDPAMSEAEALAYWMEHDKETFVAEQDGCRHLLYAAKSGRWRTARLQLRLHDRCCGCGAGHCAPHVRTFAGVCALSVVTEQCSSTL